MMENLVLRAKSSGSGFIGKDGAVFWSTGVLEFWSVGKTKTGIST
jgi:hypothetical protein